MSNHMKNKNSEMLLMKFQELYIEIYKQKEDIIHQFNLINSTDDPVQFTRIKILHSIEIQRLNYKLEMLQKLINEYSEPEECYLRYDISE